MGGLADAAGASVSATVCVTFPAGQFPESLQAASARFGLYGDISSIDLTLAIATGRLLVTYYDVRATAQVLEDYKDFAEVFPPTPHDFRSVSINAATFASLPAHFTGFHTFGDIAGVSIRGEDVVVDFFDTRAAQQVLLCIPDCRPRSPQADTLADEACEASMSMRARTTGLVEDHASCALMNMKEPVDQLPCMEHDDGLLSGPPGLKAEKPKAGVSLSAALAHHRVPLPPTGGESASPTPPATVNASVARRVRGTVTGGPGRPLREKVDSKDLSQFDIVPELVRSGEDTRTTVMVRNIPKSFSHEAFVKMLEQLNLDTRFTFFYMPYDKRRHMHSGLAFVNFKAASDVLILFEGMNGARLHGTGTAAPPAVSYARLQGQDQLMTHFSLSAVMNDNDARKRPVFMEAPKAQNKNVAERKSFSNQKGPMSIAIPACDFHGECDELLRRSGLCA